MEGFSGSKQSGQQAAHFPCNVSNTSSLLSIPFVVFEVVGYCLSLATLSAEHGADSVDTFYKAVEGDVTGAQLYSGVCCASRETMQCRVDFSIGQ